MLYSLYLARAKFQSDGVGIVQVKMKILSNIYIYIYIIFKAATIREDILMFCRILLTSYKDASFGCITLNNI